MALRVGIVYGTRPEAIKLAPLVLALDAAPGFEPVVITTGQHRDMLDEINELFGLRPQHNLDIMRPGQRLNAMASRVIHELGEPLLDELVDVAVVQGDTTTAFAAAYAAACERIPVAHVEAGLRTGERFEPFPEEINRRLITQLADLHFAPTADAAGNLLAEGVRSDDVYVTGNTVIDALHIVLDRPDDAMSRELGAFANDHPTILLTMHRRESWGNPMAGVAAAVAELCRARPGLRFVIPLHPNPEVRRVFQSHLSSFAQVLLCEPLRYSEFIKLMHRAVLVLTDSGGVQEEAPTLGAPVLVLRDRTERPEGVAAGCARLVGTDPALIVKEVGRLLDDPQAHEAMRRPGIVCYGGGDAAARCLEALRERWLPSPDEPAGLRTCR
ncbi:UDP-N-acetylglucosamine 2-epimerase (non-hydrolyzing) [Streptomyces sp. 769]|uniref:non-hydrolyzing UDP-N-acetylglucosamine 2-epimerase n=1 Tax=Streptomyces sp. 769 TaxID=1262452 RepID=UPI000580A794|nr:UDP-N-acetylglucosamine 2-epimerase (non-hydrolyzing) [Streptomyces sp. 769]AJC52650.1 putative UDP-N-acetylglucosamine 2-epimerase [Streptomyces sp. 769]AJC61889.1 putative UDP-N-acetylglucosamine 2-epimerase [Streptomyces sp. 769]